MCPGVGSTIADEKERLGNRAESDGRQAAMSPSPASIMAQYIENVSATVDGHSDDMDTISLQEESHILLSFIALLPLFLKMSA